jgi:DNA-binding transcriptional MerR regulator
MNIRELTALTDIPERQVRYLISEGFVPPPTGGRANADYGDEHVQAIRRYTNLKELGFPPAAIKLLLESETRQAPFPITPKITLQIDPALIGSGADPEPILARIRKRLAELLEEKPHGRPPRSR